VSSPSHALSGVHHLVLVVVPTHCSMNCQRMRDGGNRTLALPHVYQRISTAILCSLTASLILSTYSFFCCFRVALASTQDIVFVGLKILDVRHGNTLADRPLYPLEVPYAGLFGRQIHRPSFLNSTHIPVTLSNKGLGSTA